MILFEQDWERYPNAIADVNTTNTFFIRYCNILKELGVKNHLWPLALHQPELVGVNPHAEDLDELTMLAIDQECRANPWYFLREVLLVPKPGSLTPSKFKANRSNMCLFWCFLNHVDSGIVQPRQTGKTTGSSSLDVWLLEFGAANTLINLFTKDNGLRIETVASIKKMIGYLPEYLQAKHPNDRDNQNEVTVLKYENRMRVAVGQKSPDDANKIARGLASPVFKSDEGPFCPNADITIPAAISSGNTARDTAAETGNPYGNIFTTTAGSLNTKSGLFLYDMFTTSVPWDERLMDCQHTKDLRAKILKATRNYKCMIYGVFSHRQLGYTDEWLFEKMATASAKGESAEQDYLNLWGVGGANNPLDRDILKRITASRRLPDYIENCENDYRILWYIPENQVATVMSRGRFIMGMDSSDALGRDYIANIIIDVETFETIATFSCNETNLNNYSVFVAKLLIKYTNITFVPERKSSATSIIDVITLKMHAAGQDVFKRVFNLAVDEKDQRPDDFLEIVRTDVRRRSQHFYDSRKRLFGFVTNKNSRDLLFSMVLKSAAYRSANVVWDAQLVDDIAGLRDENGRVDHGENGHDDTVISWLLCHWLIMYGKNLGHYGIDVARIGMRVRDNDELPGDENDAEKRREAAENLLVLKESIRHASDVYETTSCGFTRHKMEVLLHNLRGQLPPEDEVVLSIDALFAKEKSERKTAHRAAGNRSVERRF